MRLYFINDVQVGCADAVVAVLRSMSGNRLSSPSVEHAAWVVELSAKEWPVHTEDGLVYRVSQ